MVEAAQACPAQELEPGTNPWRKAQGGPGCLGAGVGSPFLEVVSWRPICQGFWVRVDWVIVACGGEDCD